MATCSKSCTQNAIPLLGETLELPTARRYHMLRDARIGGDTFEIYKFATARALLGGRVDLQG